jgi:hypothetical protein
MPLCFTIVVLVLHFTPHISSATVALLPRRSSFTVVAIVSHTFTMAFFPSLVCPCSSLTTTILDGFPDITFTNHGPATARTICIGTQLEPIQDATLVKSVGACLGPPQQWGRATCVLLDAAAIRIIIAPVRRHVTMVS